MSLVFNNLPNHGHNLLYFIRYIDDILGIWTGNLTTDWKAFSEDVNQFGILKWDITDVIPSLSVNFLDMTLSIENGKFISRTFQKKMNLHLYIPSSSEHPAGCIKGTIFGLIFRYFRQNTHQKDFVYFAGLLYYRTLQRGWDRDLIRKLILEATRRAENPNPGPPLLLKTTKTQSFCIFSFTKTGYPDYKSEQPMRNIWAPSLRRKSTSTELLWPSPGLKTLETLQQRPSYIKHQARVHQQLWGSTELDWILFDFPKKFQNLYTRKGTRSQILEFSCNFLHHFLCNFSQFTVRFCNLFFANIFCCLYIRELWATYSTVLVTT